jgi:hypothetical protein
LISGRDFLHTQRRDTDLNQAEDFAPLVLCLLRTRNAEINLAGKRKEIFMNPLIQCKTTILPILIGGVLGCFGFLPKTQAVVPRPDGGYPGFNTAEGQNALFNLTTGVANTAVGWFSLWNDRDGNYNTGVGAATLLHSVATENTATGAAALFNNTTGVQNTADGAFALLNNMAGNFNTATGDAAIFTNTFGSSNTAIGLAALANNQTGNGNIAVGFQAGFNVTTATNVICIGSPVLGENVSNTCYIGEIHTTVQPQVGTDPDYVTINCNGRLGRANFSSRRYKHDIKPMEKTSEVLYALKPVSFRYKKEYDATQTLAFGLIAEEVAEANPNLVGRNKKGEPESVRYEQINAMLLNEFLKEHRKNEQQQATIAS